MYMAFAQSGRNFPIKIKKRVDAPWHVCHGVFLRAENNLRDAIHGARARAYHTQTSEGTNTILLQMTEAFITDVTGCIVVTADGHTTVRTGDGFYTERLLAQIRATAGANLG